MSIYVKKTTFLPCRACFLFQRHSFSDICTRYEYNLSLPKSPFDVLALEHRNLCRVGELRCPSAVHVR